MFKRSNSEIQPNLRVSCLHLLPYGGSAARSKMMGCNPNENLLKDSTNALQTEPNQNQIRQKWKGMILAQLQDLVVLFNRLVTNLCMPHVMMAV